jgi:hypothetical protein
MSLVNEIKDGEGGEKRVGVKTTDIFGNGLKVYTFKGVTREYQGAYLTNQTYGTDMAQDGTPAGVPDEIHDGTDSVLWTASAINGTWTFDSTAQANTGTKSVDATATVNGNIAQFAKGSTVTGANYVSITGFIYLTSFPVAGTKQINIVSFDTGLGSSVGLTADIGNYIDKGTLNAWQQFTIPLTALSGTADFDAIRIETVDVGPQNAPAYYLDDIQLEQNGGGGVIKYNIGPEAGDIWKVNGLHITMADDYAGTVINGTMPSIPYTGFFNVSSLANGINIQRLQLDDIKFNLLLKDFIDLMGAPMQKTLDNGSDGTNSWISVTLKFPEPFLLYGDTKDKVNVIISDDLSALLHFKMSLSYSQTVDEI